MRDNNGAMTKNTEQESLDTAMTANQIPHGRGIIMAKSAAA